MIVRPPYESIAASLRQTHCIDVLANRLQASASGGVNHNRLMQQIDLAV